MADKIHIPSGTAGITSYTETGRNSITFQPGHIVLVAIVIIALVLALHMFQPFV